MNGIHDLGGMTAFGPVRREDNEPVFHEPWEKRIFAIRVVTGIQGFYSTDEFRYSIERMDPAQYLASSYYERWIDAVERLLVEKGYLTKEEVTQRVAELRSGKTINQTGSKNSDPGIAERIWKIVRRGSSTRREDSKTKPRFSPGDRVMTRNMNPQGHTRMPRYVRSKQGVVDRLQGIFVFPDSYAHGRGEQPQVVYSVRFSAVELWGNGANALDSVYVDLWESYLEPVGGSHVK